MHRARIWSFSVLGLVTVFAGSVFADEEAAIDVSRLKFHPLLKGDTLEGWMGAVDGYEVKDGVLSVKQKSGGNLLTKKEYKNFVVRFEFKLPAGGNSGFGIHCPPKTEKASMAYEGFESQILDNTAEKYAKLHAYQYHGSIYGIQPAKRGYLKPLGEWNSEEIRVVGHHFTVILNGVTIVDVDVDKIVKDGNTMDGKEHPGLKRYQGHIGFLGHGPGIAFRKLEIAEIE